MRLRSISVLALAFSAVSFASAASFDGYATISMLFSSGSGNFSWMDTPSSSYDLTAMGTDFSVSVSTNAYGSNPYTLFSEAMGTVNDGTISSSGNATHQFTVKNSGASTINFQIDCVYSISAMATQTGGYAESEASIVISGFDLDGTHLFNDDSNNGSFSIFGSLRAHQTKAIDFTTSVDGYATAQAVPEPASMAVLGMGALGLIRRRRSSK